MIYVLVFWIFASGGNGGNVVMSQEFTASEKCENRGRFLVKRVQDKGSAVYDVGYTCDPK